MAGMVCTQTSSKIYKSFRSPGNAFVEGDASSASYFLAGAAVTGGTVTVEGCGTSSLQVLSEVLFQLLWPSLRPISNSVTI